MSESAQRGILSLASPLSVSDTTVRVVEEIEKAGMRIFAQIDHQENARAVGVSMRPTTLVIFGSPEVGTPLMQSYPSVAIDLPLKALVWEDADGQVWLSTNDPNYLQSRHGMTATPFQALPGLLKRVVGAAEEE